MVGLIFCISAHGQSAPPVSRAQSSAREASNHERLSLSLKSPSLVVPDSIDITVIPVKIAAISSGQVWATAADNLINDYLTGKLKTDTIFNSPTDYQVITDGIISWKNLLFSPTIPMWFAQLNPPAPFNIGTGPVIEFLMAARPKSGKNGVSLRDLLASFDSTDPDKTFADGVTFRNQMLTKRAFVIKEDGTRVTEGSSDLPGAVVVVLVQLPLFNGGDSIWGINQVEDWAKSHQYLVIDCTVRAAGDPNSEVRTKLSFNPLPSPLAPTLIITANPAVGTVSLKVAGDRSRSYTIHVADSPRGPWTVLRSVSGDNEVVVKNNGTSQFYKAVAN